MVDLTATRSIEIEGCEVVIYAHPSIWSAWGVPIEGATPTSPHVIQPGDLYTAQRNTGPHLLTCQYVKTWEDNAGFQHADWCQPVEMAYSFDAWECHKVISIDGEPVGPS